MERSNDQICKQENSSSLLTQDHNSINPKETNTLNTESPRRQVLQLPAVAVAGGGGGGININNDRLKRDEWSEGAVSSLLEAYESKWILRNRAKLKGQDWEDVAKHVSARTNNTKSAKTQTQCKNKIESMKKRYRSESAASEASSWPLYSRLDHLLRGNGSSAAPPPPPPVSPLPLEAAANVLLSVLPQESWLNQTSPAPPPPVAQHVSVAQNSHGSNGLDRLAKGDVNNIVAKMPDPEPDKNRIDDTDSSTPAVCMEKEKSNTKPYSKVKKKPRRKRGEYWEIGESMRLLAQVVMRSEQARMETMKEIERMRAEAEAKRGEMDLKKTEIIANTQLEIARLFAKGSVDSSLRIGRS